MPSETPARFQVQENRALALLALAMAFVGSVSEARAATRASLALGAATLPVAGSLAANLPSSGGREALLPLVAFAHSPHLVPGVLPAAPRPEAKLPRVFAPTQPRERYTRYPWRREIVTTVFWIGERPTRNNPTPNHMSAWDMRWVQSYGGYDNPSPDAREGYIPAAFTPGQNPFYFALPYNDISRAGTKPSARAMVPWFEQTFYRSGRTVLKGRWMAIRKGDRICFAQWEDVGPFETDDVEYVFGDARPKTKGNRGAGLDVSPAVRDYLEFDGGYGTVDWRFVDVDEVPDGPWREWGTNNPFANALAEAAPLQPANPLEASELRMRLLLAALDGGAEGAEGIVSRRDGIDD